MIQINPYLNFPGSCLEAFEFYRSIFGGEFTYLSRFKDMPENSGMPVAEEDREKILHVSLPIGKNILMGSDVASNQEPPAKYGNHIQMTLSIPDQEEGRRVFEALSEGGQVFMPLQQTFWSPLFGMLIDRYGIPWMVDCSTE